MPIMYGVHNVHTYCMVGMMCKWKVHKNECVVWEKGAAVGKRKTPPFLSQFPPILLSFFLHFVDPANSEPGTGKYMRRGASSTTYFVQILRSLQNYSCTFEWIQYGPRNIYTHFMKEVGWWWMVIQWVERPYLYRTVDGGALIINPGGPLISSTSSP